jgi:thiol-disulfide isomerase/thioredoxin
MSLSCTTMVKLIAPLKDTSSWRQGVPRLPALIYGNVQWCGYCKRARPEIQKAADIMGASFPVVDLDADKFPLMAKAMKITSYPTIMYADANGRLTHFKDDRVAVKLVDFVCSQAFSAHGFCGGGGGGSRA